MDHVCPKRSVFTWNRQHWNWQINCSQKLLFWMRIKFSELAGEFLMQPLHTMPNTHHLSHLLILDCYKKLNYEGTGHVQNELRSMNWIPHFKSNARRVLPNCSLSKRRQIKPQPPLMESLQKDRLQVAPSFSKVEVDYFRPIMVKHCRKHEKCYGCLFTCLVTRAVHLEVARSLIETDPFINALTRFVARWGR